MGYLSNPVGLRLGLNRAWLIKGTSDVYHQNNELYSFLHKTCKALFSRKTFQQMGFIYSHITFRVNNLSIFLFDARLETLFLKVEDEFVNWVETNWSDLQKTEPISEFIKISEQKIELFTYLVRETFTEIREPIFLLLRIKLYQMYMVYLTNKRNSHFDFSVQIYTLSNSSLSAKALNTYVLRKLKANNSLNAIFSPIINGFSSYFKGIRVYCSGRFTRNQRATFRVFWFGKVTLNNFSELIDYNFSSIPLKFGVGGIKIWISRKKYIYE